MHQSEAVERLERAVAVMGVFVFRARVFGGKQMNSVEDLEVFKLAHELALKTYSATKAFAREELFSLGDQTRRATAIRHSL